MCIPNRCRLHSQAHCHHSWDFPTSEDPAPAAITAANARPGGQRGSYTSMGLSINRGTVMVLLVVFQTMVLLSVSHHNHKLRWSYKVFLSCIDHHCEHYSIPTQSCWHVFRKSTYIGPAWMIWDTTVYI